MSLTLSIKQGIIYFTDQRDKSTTQDRWSHYDSEIKRLERKLYELELEKEFRIYDKAI